METDGNGLSELSQSRGSQKKKLPTDDDSESDGIDGHTKKKKNKQKNKTRNPANCIFAQEHYFVRNVLRRRKFATIR